jgi:hypothetical protein
MPAGHGAGLRLDPSSAYIDGPMTESLQVQCCIAGGGPAGMMLGFLLGRAGVKTVVLEKHADFLRDFRGDTVHPSTLSIMGELGLIEEFLKLPHSELRTLSAEIGEHSVAIADFARVPVRRNFVALMPQWDFLNFLNDPARSARDWGRPGRRLRRTFIDGARGLGPGGSGLRLAHRRTVVQIVKKGRRSGPDTGTSRAR